jgi:alkylhydroperoxidase family enzyme
MMARVRYVEKHDLAPEFQDILDNPSNLNRATANAPAGRQALMQVGRFIRNTKLDRRLRELAILQVSYGVRSAYEWSHHIKSGLEGGVSRDDIDALVDFNAGRPAALDELTQTILRATRELTTSIEIQDSTFIALTKYLDIETLTELVITIAYYNASVRIIAALKIDAEQHYLRYLDQFPLPD